MLFYRDSLLLASVSLIVTLVVRRMDAASSPPPVWITTVTDAVQATLPGRILLSGEVENDKVGLSYSVIHWHTNPIFSIYCQYVFGNLIQILFSVILFLCKISIDGGKEVTNNAEQYN